MAQSNPKTNTPLGQNIALWLKLFGMPSEYRWNYPDMEAFIKEDYQDLTDCRAALYLVLFLWLMLEGRWHYARARETAKLVTNPFAKAFVKKQPLPDMAQLSIDEFQCFVWLLSQAQKRRDQLTTSESAH